MRTKDASKWIGVLTALVCHGLLAGSASAQRYGRAAGPPPRPSITVTGMGQVFARPDQATITVGVTNQSQTASAAVKANSASMRKMMDVLHEHSIAEKDIQTTNFSVQPSYNYVQNKPPEVTGYNASNSVQIKVRKLDSLGELLDALVEGGGNQTQGISFSVAQPETLLNDARAKAVHNARFKARILAKAAGAEVGRAIVIEEQGDDFPRPMSMQAMAIRSEGVPISSGEQTLTARVQVTFALETGEPDTGERPPDPSD